MIVCVKRFTTFLVQFSNHLARVLVEQIDEALEHVQMECGRDELAMRTPFVACAQGGPVVMNGEKKKPRIMNGDESNEIESRKSRIFNLNRCLAGLAGIQKMKRTRYRGRLVGLMRLSAYLC